MVQTRSQLTKSALIEAAFKRFAEKGFAATSTREIAAAAQTNIGSITYHFGGKQGLRMACAEAIVSQLSRLRNSPDAVTLPKVLPAPVSRFEDIALRQATLLLSLPQANLMISFLFREAQDQSEAFEHIYQDFFAPMHSLFCQMWEVETGMAAESEQTKLAIFTMIGQIVYFRFGQPIVTRRMGWSSYGDSESLAILTLMQRNIRAMLADYGSL